MLVAALAVCLVWGLSQVSSLPGGIVAALCLTSLMMTTGAMHEDGLADCADGFWGAWQPERRLEIMRDSQIGSYGTLALILSVLLRWYCLTLLIEGGALWVLIPVAALSRGAMVGVMQGLPNVRAGGLSERTGRPGRGVTIAALALATVPLVLVPPAVVLALLFASLATALCCASLAKIKIGGQTGDVLGAVQQCTEVILLIVCVAAVT